MSFKNVLIKGIIDIQNVKTENIDFEGSYVSGVFSMSNFKIKNFATWHSARFLKNEAIKINNNIEALECKAKEVELYKDEIFKELKQKLSFKKIAEYISILINGLFSEHGQNWIKALLTTFIVGFAIYFVFYIDLHSILNFKINLQGVIKSFVSYIIPTNFEIIIKYMGKEYINFFVRMCGAFVYFFGKITMWYGSVQIVSSFRKYNKY